MQIEKFHFIQELKSFFNKQEFLEVITPPAVQNPGMETHIHPFYLSRAKDKENSMLYMHTSPEFCMKKILADSPQAKTKIYQICYCFRDEPESEIHRPQFLMLEWYRAGEHYDKIKQDCKQLLSSLYSKYLPYQKVNFTEFTVQDLFVKYLDIQILDFLEKDSLYNLMLERKFDLPLPPKKECAWDDLFFLLWLNLIEPNFKDFPFLLVDKFPAPLSALSTIDPTNDKVCDRFELFINGIEIANCFNELTSLKEQKLRFFEQAQAKFNTYGYALPEPSEFYETLDSGYPRSAGIALGVERLYAQVCQVENPF